MSQGIAGSQKAAQTLRFWKASLAWKNIDNWAKGWTTGSFIQEVRSIAADPGLLGYRADSLLDDVIHDRERTPLATPAVLIRLRRAQDREPKILVNN